jgi:hypothetical protein
MTPEGSTRYYLPGYVLGLLVLAIVLASVGLVLLNLQTYPLMLLAGLISVGLAVLVALEAVLTWRQFAHD